ncbi:MAG: hypothetical protein AB7T38_10405 [Nitrospirales bacterium]
MFEEIKFVWAEWKLERTFRPHFALAKKGGEDVQSLENEYAYELACLREEQRLQYQKQLLRKARRLFIQIPKYTEKSGDWEKSGVLHGYMLLTDKAIKQLRNDIREEVKNKREIVLGWIVPFSGIIGTIVGFLLAQL